MEVAIIGLDWNTVTGVLSIELNTFILVSVGCVLLTGLIILFVQQRNRFPLVDVAVEISSSPKIIFTIKRDDVSLYLANRIYIELLTRKVVLPFEEGSDVLVELYDSWYSLFGSIRNELKSISGEQIRSSTSSQALIALSLQILNKGLRPHLTTYQATFRKWYKTALEEPKSKHLSPQEIQKQFPQYKELIEDMRNVQQVLTSYVIALEKLIGIKNIPKAVAKSNKF